MATKKADIKKKIALVGVGAAVAGSIAAAIVLSDEKNRKKVKKIAGDLKTKSEDVFSELKKLAQKAVPQEAKLAKSPKTAKSKK